MTHHIMIDVETLGILPSAPVFQIGVVLFDDSMNVGHEWEWDVDITSQIVSGAIVEQGAVDFWKPRELKRSCVMTTRDALINLGNVFHDYAPKTVWANGPAFDLILLRRMFQNVGLSVPWSHRAERDYRTVVKTALLLDPDHNRNILPDGVAHTGLADALQQVATLGWALGALGCAGRVG